MISREAMFEACKRHIMADDAQPDKIKQWTRYNVVQYLCSFPKLDPDEMAAALIREGVDVRFDDGSISAADNAKHQRRVMRIVRAKVIMRPAGSLNPGQKGGTKWSKKSFT